MTDDIDIDENVIAQEAIELGYEVWCICGDHFNSHESHGICAVRMCSCSKFRIMKLWKPWSTE